MRLNRGLALTSAMVLMLGTSACGGSDKDNSGTANGGKKVAHIALVIDTTGTAAPVGTDVKHGAELAVDEINKSGKLGDIELKLTVTDGTTQVPREVNLINQAINSDAIAVGYSPYAPGVGATAPLAQRAKVPFISIAGDQPDVLDVGEYIFHTSAAPDSYQGALAKYWADKGVKSVVRIWDSDNGSLASIAKAWTPAAKENGLEIVKDYPIKLADTEFSAIASQIASLNPDAIELAALANQFNTIATQLKRAGWKGEIGGVNASVAYFLPSLEKTADGVVYPTEWSSSQTDEKTQKFVAAFKERFGDTPRVYAAQGYDGIQFVAEGLLKADSVTREGLKDGLHAVQKEGFTGLTGTYRFGPGAGGDRDALTSTPTVAQWMDGKEVAAD